MNYSDILSNPHFRRLAAVLRVPYRSQSWRRQHQDVPFWSLTRSLAMNSDAPANFLQVIADVLHRIVAADPTLAYDTSDLDWLVSMLDTQHGPTVAAMLLAYASSVDEYLTPVEAADRFGGAESTWRNKAAQGAIPGAVKKGKQWLLPLSVLEILEAE